jgi:hypothetical protein
VKDLNSARGCSTDGSAPFKLGQCSAVFETKSEFPRSFWLNATESLANIALQTVKR